jgi:hypothetical protein
MPEVRYIGKAAIEARALLALKSAVNLAAEDLQGRCQAVTPVGPTGDLKASIHVESAGEQQSWNLSDTGASSTTSIEARVMTGGEVSEYAIPVHEGVAPRVITPTNKKALYWKGAAHPVRSVNHPGFAGRKYIERPLLEFRPGYEAFIAAAARRAF